MQILRLHSRPTEFQSAHEQDSPGGFSAHSTWRSPTLPSIEHRFLYPCPVPTQSSHGCLPSWVLFCVLVPRHLHEEQLKLFAVFLSLNGNLLLYKFHTVILALAFGSIQNTHILPSPVLSLVIYRLSVLFSRPETSRCYNHSLHSFVHLLLVLFLSVLTTSRP